MCTGTPKKALHSQRWGDIGHRPLIVAHRGGADLWPENSLLAFNNALREGYRAFEIDVHGTRDGGLVVIHDATLDRTVDGHGVVCELSLAELGRFKLKGTNGEPVPRLSEVLTLFREHGAQSIVEVKFSADTPNHIHLCRGLLDEIERAGMLAGVTISAFDWRSLVELARLSPSTALTAVADKRGIEQLGGMGQTIAGAVKLGARDLSLAWTTVNTSTAHAVHAAGLRLGAWTANELDQLCNLMQLGVDWIITDRPDLVRRVSQQDWT